MIWGASSGLGAALVDYLNEHKATIIAVVRNSNKNAKLKELNIETLVCDATNEKQVLNTVRKIPDDACVISTMGSYSDDIPVDYIGHRFLINALELHSIHRFLLITSLGCGKSWKYLSERSKHAFGEAAREKSLAESWLQTSKLKYTILRPGGLKDGPVTNKGELSEGKEVHGLIHRTEAARLSYELLCNPESINRIYSCVDPSITW